MYLSVISFAVLLAYVQCQPQMPPAEMMKEHWNNALEKALRKKHGESYSPSLDDECSKACQKAPQGFGQYLIKFAKPGPETIQAIYNKEFLTKVCAFANETAQCVRACPDTQRRQFLRTIFAPVKFLCVDSHIVENADCLGQVAGEQGPACMSGTCAPKKAAFEAAIAAYGAAPPTKANSEAVLEKMCELFDCGALCGQEARQRKCGAVVEGEIRQFYNVLGKSMNEIRYFSPHDFVPDIPRVCLHDI